VTRVAAPSALQSLSPYIGSVFGTTTQIILGMVELSLLMFFMLAGGEGWDRSAAAAVGALTRGSSSPIDLLERIRGATSRYLAITFFINVGQGILVGLALWGLGVPAPFLWGGLTFFAEFIPYLGGLAMMVLLGLVGLAGHDAWTVAILPPLAYLLITTVQNNIVSPLLYGKHLDLDPVAILMSVALWWFLWGIPGAFLAVPIIAAVKILADHAENLTPLAEFLGE
jgi:predicted PurR-regulated permease PerM